MTSISNWKLRYINKLIDLGFEKEAAEECFEGGIFDFGDSPEDAAIDEISYWCEDSSKKEQHD